MALRRVEATGALLSVDCPLGNRPASDPSICVLAADPSRSLIAGGPGPWWDETVRLRLPGIRASAGERIVRVRLGGRTWRVSGN